MKFASLSLLLLLLLLLLPTLSFLLPLPTTQFNGLRSTPASDNVQQTEDTSRDKVMTFSYDMSSEERYEKPT